MHTKLPLWAVVGGAALAAIGGIVNVVGVLSFTHQSITHLTGTTTLFSIAAAHSDWRTGLHLAGVAAAFVVGAIFSGFMIEHSVLKLGRRYGLVLMVEAALLTLAALLMTSHIAIGAYLASAACGAQNAMASSYSGAVLRTTHLTGMFTDLGIVLGHWLRRTSVDWKRFRLCLLIVLAFTAGGVIGSLLFRLLGPHTLFVPAILTGCAGLGYTGYVHRQSAR